MAREILFKAKSIDGEWVEGYYCKYGFVGKEKHYIIPGYASDLYAFEIDINTLCQYTGLTDKNGNKIWEGDILKGFQYPFMSNKQLSMEVEHNYFAEVVWFENCPAFGIYTHKNPKSYVNGISEGNTEFLEGWQSDMWEVIGNIFDNPELLGGADNG